MTDFHGKIVVITGGATGLGAAVATLAAAGGGDVVILDVNEIDGRALAAKIGGRFQLCNVSDPAHWEKAAADIAVRGGADYLHLNAGIMTAPLGQSLQTARIETLPYARYRAITGTNIDGVFLGIQAMLPAMLAKGGCITVTSSAAGLIPIAFDPVYAMTKHAVIGLVRSLALTERPVRLNAFCPGGIATQIVPPELGANAANMMTPAIAAEEVADLLLNGATGEIRLKLRAGAPAEAIAPPAITLG